MRHRKNFLQQTLEHQFEYDFKKGVYHFQRSLVECIIDDSLIQIRRVKEISRITEYFQTTKGKTNRKRVRSKKENQKYQSKYIHRWHQEHSGYQRNYKKENPERCLRIQVRHLKKLGIPFGLSCIQYASAVASWSRSIKKRDNNICQICQNIAKFSHHIIHKSKYPSLSLNVNNGIALCKKCHRDTHGWFS